MGRYADEEYLWDELAAAAWLDPSIITKEIPLYMDIDISHTGATTMYWFGHLAHSLDWASNWFTSRKIGTKIWTRKNSIGCSLT
jgi:inosine-uridine nucleoside N-ribohydrolase